MAKIPPTRRKPTATSGPSAAKAGGDYQLVIVESPAKAKTIGKYLGPGFVVEASVGHIRDLPSKAPKGSKQPVPGVDLDHDFAPTYEIDDGKKKKVSSSAASPRAPLTSGSPPTWIGRGRRSPGTSRRSSTSTRSAPNG